MKIGDYEIEVKSQRYGGGWQSVGYLPNGRQVISGPSATREAAENDVRQQAMMHLLPAPGLQSQFEAEITKRRADRLLEATQNRFNPKGLKRNHRGDLLDKWGRKMATNWDEFEKRRNRQKNPLHNATGKLAETAQFGLPYGYRPYKCLTCGHQKSIGTNHTDVCFDHCPGCSWRGGMHPEGGVYHPSHTRAFQFDPSQTDQFDKLLGVDMEERPRKKERSAPPKASFYPSDGGGGGGGGGFTTA